VGKGSEIISSPKDEDRFQKIIEIYQVRVKFKDPILLPLTPHLFIVQNGEDRVIKCDCSHEFGDYRVNWKLYSMVYDRDTQEGFEI
jgi:acetone carboxylase gamma subunit